MEDEQILQLVKSLSRNHRACRYQQVDLHVHSPDSTDYNGDKGVNPHDFVSAFVDRGFDLIAITDHNTGTYIDSATEARDQIAEAEGRNIAILPGVEIHVSPGIHLLAILPSGGSAAISDLLSRLGLHINSHGDTEALVSRPIGEIAEIVHERGGMLIGAHCNSKKGVVQTIQGQPRKEWLEELDALEINSGTADDKVDRDTAYVINELGVPIPFTFGSDSHDCASETSGMWVKMAEPSLTSLRQLVFEPHLRISKTRPDPPVHGRIVGFTTTKGIYANARFKFSPNLNVLVGGRGAGKSAAIDVLRFAFEAEPRSGDVSDQVFANRIVGFLQSIGEVIVVVTGADGETYVIIRSGAYEKPNARSTPVFKEPSRVYQLADSHLVLRDMRPSEVLSIEFYGQGEAARLADRVNEQLRLIDENLDMSVSTMAIADAEQRLGEDETQLIQQKRRLEELRVEAANRSRLEERQRSLSGSLDDPIFAERSKWDQEKDWVLRHHTWVQKTLDSLPNSFPERTIEKIDLDKSSAKTILQNIQDWSDGILERGQTDLTGLRNTLIQAISELNGYRTEWNEAFEIAEKQYIARLTELEAENKEAIAVELRSVEQELSRIETSVNPEIQSIESHINSLQGGRAENLEILKTARTEMSRLRADFVRHVNSKLGGDVTVDLSGRDTALYSDAIDLPLQGSGMYNRADGISSVCEEFNPEEFVQIIRSADKEKLMALGVTDHSASLMVNALTDEVLYHIERVDVPPLPRIRIKREGESVLTDLSSLSVGEKCSAILSIALLSKGKPLIIDQPEDDLDHAFIIGSIVEGIRTAKSERQIVAASHNPNIPVLGDAEMVWRVARKVGDDVCRIVTAGGLELPQVTREVQNLEGGADAFERRRQRYSSTA